MHKKRRRKSKAPVIIAIIVALAVIGVAVWAALQMSGGGVRGNSSLPSGSGQPAASGSGSGSVAQTQQEADLPEEMRAMWISFLEWQQYDISTEAAMRQVAGKLFDDCKDMGLNTVLVMVRPFGDALYKSEVYPWSHLITGIQGQDPGYDPLAVMIEEAHARGLRLEAWINPYRVQHASIGPKQLSADNPAVLHPDWAQEVQGALWYDPGIAEVQDMVVEGVREIVQNYDVDGIHFDDYFYPEGNTEDFDAASYAALGQGMDRAAWRRENVNTLVSRVYATIKSIKPTLAFGISPQGNNENNYNTQHSDVNMWMKTPGYVDYIMPQNYWGFDYQSSNGSDKAAFGNKCAEWAGYERLDSIKLYNGLGAYRIGVGDGGANDQSEWSSGHNIADQIAYARGVEGFTGFALFRYEFLVADTELAVAEKQALTNLLTQ
ncbi:MAG: glycoside hydrolase family 10 protein [Oscillospiraceae bacterium]